LIFFIIANVKRTLRFNERCRTIGKVSEKN